MDGGASLMALAGSVDRFGGDGNGLLVLFILLIYFQRLALDRL